MGYPSPVMTNLQKPMEMLKTINNTSINSSVEGYLHQKENKKSFKKIKVFKYQTPQKVDEKPVKLNSLRYPSKTNSKFYLRLLWF